MNWLKSKFFWLNAIAIVVLIIQYFVNNEILVKYVAWESLAIVVLNAIAGMIQAQQIAKLKKQLAIEKHNAKLARLHTIKI